MYYKDLSHNIHVLEDTNFEYLLPVNSIRIPDEEAEVLLAGLNAASVDLLPVHKQLSSLVYLDLFTETEQLAVVTATMQSAQIKIWYDKMLAAEYITLADVRTEQGLDLLVTLSLLTPERKAQIITAMK